MIGAVPRASPSTQTRAPGGSVAICSVPRAPAVGAATAEGSCTCIVESPPRVTLMFCVRACTPVPTTMTCEPESSPIVSGVWPRTVPSIATADPAGSDVTVRFPVAGVTAASPPLDIIQ